ncbi:MAG: carboxymuconolactone decarboxylase family protein [Actinomycetota bacterium]|nr:carboxymuconolactone decarboxylase family protein [Actinomycetota bacterium]
MAEAPRIAPIEPPYEPEIEATLMKWMPPGAEIEPLKLFRTLMVHPELSARMRPLGAALLGHPTIDPREREIVIHRATARAGAEYEWGVHAVAFGRPLGLTDEQIGATATGGADDPAWTSERDRLLVRLVDELHDTATVSDELWGELAREWEPPQLLELVVCAGWYRLISQVINAARVELEPWAERLPAPAGERGQ